MRLIDADELIEHAWRDKLDNRELIVKMIDNAPTVKAIPKAVIKKFLEEGTKDVSNNVLAIVREDYIHKSDYVNRLKADMVAMLDELDLELYEQYEDTDLVKVKYIRQSIQQKIDKLKGEQGT